MRLYRVLFLMLLAVILLSSFSLAADTQIYSPDQPSQAMNPSSGSCEELCANNPDCNCGNQTCDCQGDGACVQQADVVQINFFYSETCPHCHEGMKFFEELANNRSDFELKKYEVVHNDSQREFAIDFCEEKGVPFQSVPTFFIGDKYFVGYGPTMNAEIIEAIDVASLALRQGNKSNNSTELAITELVIFGKTINIESLSLPVLTFVVALADGFNPCAFFILVFLLSMLVYAKSKSRMLLIGLTFVFFSALIYFMSMAILLNLFQFISPYKKVVTLIAGIVALAIAAINIKDFFAFKKGVSLSVSDDNRGKLIKRMRNLLKAESFWSMFAGAVVLAITANLYELLCTLGLPFMYTATLQHHALPSLSYYSYILLYNVIYVLPLLVIVLLFTFTLGSKKLSQKQGEALKLLSGMMMLAFGIMFVFKPELLGNGLAALGFVLLAIVLTAIIIIIRNFLNKRKGRNPPQNGVRPVRKEE